MSQQNLLNPTSTPDGYIKSLASMTSVVSPMFPEPKGCGVHAMLENFIVYIDDEGKKIGEAEE